ncbi:MAG: MotA/TolQ/ExbB proton channel family protein [Gammaproteobacteria bacterium]|nr:MotA/TolQ/ExbB proton channel family protein [Gammaproteobacteria bacterium]
MFELIQSGGWLMVPIILCSVIAFAIICERFWALQKKRICPKELVPQILKLAKDDQLHERRISEIRILSPLGRVLASGLSNLKHSREVMKESIEDTGRHVVLEMERFLNTLGTIAAITPLLGLLGTVIGMIKVFTAITEQGTGNPAVLAGGISEALITTAAGLTVAIPTLIFHRYFQRRVDELVCTMEQESIKMVEILHGERDIEENQR